jgi:hypothetical protein
MLGTGYMMKMAKDKEGYEKYRTQLVSQMQCIKNQLDDAP